MKTGQVRCKVCGKFIGSNDKIKTERIYDNCGIPVEDIIYHINCNSHKD